MRNIIKQLKSFCNPVSESVYDRAPTWQFKNDAQFKKAMEVVEKAMGRISYNLLKRQIVGSSFHDTKEMDAIQAALEDAGFKPVRSKKGGTVIWVKGKPKSKETRKKEAQAYLKSLGNKKRVW